MSDSHTNGLTRRELLKRGAAVGGALWAVPVVQMIGMNPAMAAVPSDVCICIKTSQCDDQANWTVLGQGRGNCIDDELVGPVDCDRSFDPSGDPDYAVGNCTPVVAGTVCIEFNGDGTATIYFPKHCDLIFVAEKGGSDTCTERTPAGPGEYDDEGAVWSYTFPIIQGGGQGCSHVEVCIQC